ncbi:hypothetical protein MPSEU_000390900 [Mayamaea pseudoterrestris]|nr:hypothetical protein MPSEU_000390900 [Mayamaea pseudoterrestris]
MGDSDDGINEHSIFDLDHAPPPPSHRGVGRTLSPSQTKQRSYTLSPLKHKDKPSARSRLWSTDSGASTAIKSIWSDNIMEPNFRSSSNNGAPPPLPAFLERRTSSAGSSELEHRERRSSSAEFSRTGSFRNMTQTNQQDNRRPSLKDMVLRSLSPQPSSEVAPASSDDDETSIQNLELAAELPLDRSSGSLTTSQIGRRHTRGGGEESNESLFSDNDQTTRPRRHSSTNRKVSFGSNSFQDGGVASSGTMGWSPDLSDAQVMEEGEAEASSSAASSTDEIDYEYGDPVDAMDDGIGLSSSRNSGLQSSMTRQRTESQNSVGNWSVAQSEWSDQKNNDETDVEDETEHDPTTHQAMNARPSVVIAGVRLPAWVPPLPAVNDISVKVVTYCFCGCCCGPGLRQLTDRSILGRLNVLIALLSVFPLCATAFLAMALYGPLVNLDRQISPQLDTPLNNGPAFSISETLWNMNGRMLLTGFFSFVSGCASVFTWRVVRDVDLLGAIRYLWVLVWILPCFLFCVVSLIDRFDTTIIWVQHFWRSPQMAWFRKRHCQPTAYYNTLCTVPMVDNETEWCIDNYNSTDCSMVRDSAQEATQISLRVFYTLTAVWSMLQVFIVLLAIHTLENIISKPLVQKSRESNVPGWLTLPCIGCLALGGFLTFGNQSTLNSEITNRESIAWLIGPMYISTGGCFVVAAILGWYISNVSILSTMDKRRKLLAVYSFTIDMVILVLLLFGIFGLSVGYIVNMKRNPVSDQVRGDFACNANYLGACTGCDRESNRCPEWSSADVTSILQTQAKASATVAAIFVCYCFSSIRFGFVMMKRISMYQIAYV